MVQYLGCGDLSLTFNKRGEFMNYKLIKSSNDDIAKLIDYKKKTIFEYAKDLPINEINKINNYVKKLIKQKNKSS